MQKNIVWNGVAYNSIENCIVDFNSAGAAIRSVITGSYDKTPYVVRYAIHTNDKWHTIMVEVETQAFDKIQKHAYITDGNGHWFANRQQLPAFDHCTAIDISLSPFTNTLAIRQLNLAVGAHARIRVLYFDILEQQIRPVEQSYTRLAANSYKFETVPNDFEATITVDESGLVQNYPGLFSCRMVNDSRFAASDRIGIN